MLLVAACTPAPLPPSPAPTPTATPDFTLNLDVEASLRPAPLPGEWIVTGLALAGPNDVETPRLSLVLRDSTGAELDRRTVDVQPDPLPAGASWPFRETFALETTPSTVHARLQGDSGNAAQRPLLQGEVLRTFIDSRGGTVALGSLANEATRQAFVTSLRVAGRDAAGALQEVLDVRPARRQLEPGEVTPFLAALPPEAEALEWEVYSIAAFGDGSDPAIEIVEQTSADDDQGHPFVTTVLRNISEDPRFPAITGILGHEDAWLSGEAFELPVALAPGEQAAISLRVPGLGLSPEAEIEWLLVTDSTAAEGRSIPVASEVIDFQPLGSTLVLGVRLTAGQRPVGQPAVQAALIGENGVTLSAAWGAGPAALGPGESAVVPLALPIPRGFDLAQGQLDVRAVGLP
jgi:hypothetical protein